MVPWAILGTLGLVRVGEWLAARSKTFTLPRLTSAVLGGGAIAAAVVQIFVAGRDGRSQAELDLMVKMKTAMPPGEMVLINADTDSLRFFRLQYTVRRDARLIQNLSFLLDAELDRPELYVLTKASDEAYLRTLGAVKRLAQTEPTKKNATPGSQFVIFRLRPAPGLPRTAVLPAVGVLQAMGRAPGPWLDPNTPEPALGPGKSDAP